MNVVKFPEFNIEMQFSRIAFSIFGIEVYKYAVCIVLGIIVAITLSKFSKEKFDNTFDNFIEILVYSLASGILGARLYFVLFKLGYYVKNPSQVLNFRDGGLAIYGGLISGIIVAIILCKKRKIDILNFLDYGIPFVAIAQAFGRWGNFFNVEAYGYETTSIFRMGIEVQNKYMEVHPVFLYESVLDLTIFIILRIMQKKRKFKGQIFLLYAILYSFIRTFLEGLRTDSLMFFNFRISQILSIVIFGISIFYYVEKCRKMSNEKSSKS